MALDQMHFMQLVVIPGSNSFRAEKLGSLPDKCETTGSERWWRPANPRCTHLSLFGMLPTPTPTSSRIFSEISGLSISVNLWARRVTTDKDMLRVLSGEGQFP